VEFKEEFLKNFPMKQKEKPEDILPLPAGEES